MAKLLDIKLLARLGTLRQLEIFLHVAEAGSVSRAAETLNLTQPSVSIQVKKLSDVIGLPLYEVIGKKLKLTEAGRKVEEAGKEIFKAVGRLDNEINNLKGLQSGTLSISVVTTSKYFMPYVMAPFCELYPGVEVELNIGNRSNIMERLNKNLDDLYIFSKLPESLDIVSYPFLPNPIAVVASKKHELANKKKLRWDDIRDVRFIMREAGSDSLFSVNNYLKENNYKMTDVMTIQSNEAIKHAVMANMGISIISAYTLSNADTDGIVQLDVEGFPLISQWEVVHMKEKKLSLVAQKFLDFTLNNGRNLLPMKKIERNVQSAIDGKWGS
ncbi:LysR family transcriptional regulator [Emcibacteraceae bacterium]|nr:LysR family transcriptional regulator [Emcibacteraceae bacterium]MDC0081558.1 LysR family transcriptional regulator [Emcibacteraceae bacterium]